MQCFVMQQPSCLCSQVTVAEAAAEGSVAEGVSGAGAETVRAVAWP